MNRAITFQLTLLTVVFSLFTHLCLAQVHRAELNFDSLAAANEGYNKQDEYKLTMLNQLALGYEKRNPDKGITTADQAIALAQKLNAPMLLAEAYNNKGLNHKSRNQFPEALDLYEKAIAINTRKNNKYGIATNTYNIGWINYLRGEHEKAVEYYENALNLFEEINNKESIAKVYNGFGNIFFQSENGKALEYYQKALSINEHLGNISGMAINLGNIGMVYHSLSNYPRTLEYYQKSISINEKLGNKSGMSASLGNIGIIYMDLSDFPKALVYLQQALSIEEELGNKSGKANLLSNIGNVYIQLFDHPKALEYYKESLSIHGQLGNKNRLSSVLSNIGHLYQYLSDSSCIRMGIVPAEKYPKAIEYHQRALKINEEMGNKNDIATNLGNIGNIYNDAPDAVLSELGIEPRQRYAKALHMHQQCMAIALEMSSLNRQKWAWQNLSITYERQRNFSKALDAYKKHIVLRDSVQGEEVRNEITRKEMQFEFDKKETEIRFHQQLIEEQLQRSEADMARRRTERNGFVVGSGMLMLGLLFVFRQRNKLKKTNQLLDVSNKCLDNTNRNLHNTQSQLVQQEKLASLGALTAGIAHEIKNPLNFVNNFSELSNEMIDELETVTDPEERSALLALIKENLSRINEHGKRADNIVKSMLEHSRSSTAEKQITNLNKLMEEFANLAYHGMRVNVPDFNCSIEKHLAPALPELMLVQQDVGRVLLNLFNNAFFAVKHKPDGVITITSELKNDHVLLSVKDNGAGMSEEVQNKIFEPFFTTKPTGQGTGLGLSMSFDIIKAHGGSIAVQSKEGEGSEFVIQLSIGMIKI